MLSSQIPPVHPVLGCAHTISTALDDVALVNPVFMSTADKRDALLALGRAEARLVALRLQLLAVAGDVADLTAARSAGEWAAHELRLDPREGRKDQAAGTALESRYPHLGAAMRAGDVQRPQAEVIIKALDTLPTDLDHETLTLAEKVLTAEAEHFTPTRLRPGPQDPRDHRPRPGRGLRAQAPRGRRRTRRRDHQDHLPHPRRRHHRHPRPRPRPHRRPPQGLPRGLHQPQEA